MTAHGPSPPLLLPQSEEGAMSKQSAIVSRRRHLSALASIMVLATLLAACAAPFAAPVRGTVGFSAAMLASQLGSRSLSTLESLNVVVQDSAGNEIYNQTATSAPSDGKVTIELERERDYRLLITITNRETPDGSPMAWVYATDFTVPAEGGVDLEVVLPSLAEWTGFMDVIKAIGKLVGFESGATGGPMQAAYDDAGASSALSGSGTTADGAFSWAWNRESADPAAETKVTVTSLNDLPLTPSAYTLLAGSIQEFSSGTAQSCTLDWRFSGGVISQVKASYTGGGKTAPVFTEASVNGFDFKALFEKIGGDYVTLPDMGVYSEFFEKDMPAINAAIGMPSVPGPSPSSSPIAGSAAANLQASLDTASAGGFATNSGAGDSDDGSFHWQWSGTGYGTVTKVFTANRDVVLASPSAATLKAGSSHTEGYETVDGQTGGFTDFNFSMDNSPVQSLLLRHFHSGSLYRFMVFSINGDDWLVNVTTVTVRDYDTGDLLGSYDTMKGSKLGGLAPVKPGSVLDGYFMEDKTTPWDPATVVVNGPVTLYARWIPLSAGGDGSSANPFLVSNAQELYNVRLMSDITQSTSGAYAYRQTADIDFTGSPWESGWTPIGAMDTGGFSGSYDGNGKLIANLKVVSVPASSAAGLFGMTYEARFMNVTLVDVDIKNLSGSSTGALAGYLGDGYVYRCSSSGLVSSDSPNTGGLVGMAYSTGTGPSKMEESFSSAHVTGVESTGGLVGSVMGTNGFTILNSYVNGSVFSVGSSAYLSTAGLVGSGNGNTVLVSCYAAAAVGSSPMPSPQAVMGPAASPGGGSASDVFWDPGLSPGASNTVAGAQPLSGTTRYLQSTYASAGWDFTGTWGIAFGYGYPHLQRQVSAPPPLIPGPLARYTFEDPGTTISGSWPNSGMGGGAWDAVFSSVSLDSNKHPSWPLSLKSMVGPATMAIGTHDIGAAFTIAAWLYFPPGSIAAYNGFRPLCGNQADTGNPDGFAFGTIEAGPNANLVFQYNDGAPYMITAPEVILYEQRWYSVALTKSAAGTVRFFIDGRQVGPDHSLLSGFPSIAALTLFSHANGADQTPAHVDELRIYPVELSPAQVAGMY
jgi:hypothetical protein